MKGDDEGRERKERRSYVDEAGEETKTLFS
jgi:hypothetical protein